METPGNLKRSLKGRLKSTRLRDVAIGCVCAFGLLLGAISVAGTAFAADAYPTRPLRIIVPFPPGAITDATERTLATELGKVVGQSVVVENKPGAGTLIGTQAAKAAPADGYTVLFQLSSLATNIYLLKQPGYALSDFKPVAMFGQSAFVLVASKKFRSTLQDLVAFGKAHPGELNCSGTGDGAATVIGSKLKQAAGIDWTLINYKGGAEAVQAVMAGDVHFSLPTQAAPLIYANPDKLNVSGRHQQEARRIPAGRSDIRGAWLSCHRRRNLVRPVCQVGYASRCGRQAQARAGRGSSFAFDAGAAPQASRLALRRIAG